MVKAVALITTQFPRRRHVSKKNSYLFQAFSSSVFRFRGEESEFDSLSGLTGLLTCGGEEGRDEETGTLQNVKEICIHLFFAKIWGEYYSVHFSQDFFWC